METLAKACATQSAYGAGTLGHIACEENTCHDPCEIKSQKNKVSRVEHRQKSEAESEAKEKPSRLKSSRVNVRLKTSVDEPEWRCVHEEEERNGTGGNFCEDSW
eukprot:2372283-Pleurochrysis_carterae.AAC.2